MINIVVIHSSIYTFTQARRGHRDFCAPGPGWTDGIVWVRQGDIAGFAGIIHKIGAIKVSQVISTGWIGNIIHDLLELRRTYGVADADIVI